MRSTGNRITYMFEELQKIDNEFENENQFITGYYVEGGKMSCELLDSDLLKRIMLERGYFVLFYDEDMYSISHSWVDGGMFGSFIIQQHFLDVPGMPIRQLDIHSYFPSIADFLTGEINAFQDIVEDIVDMFGVSGSIMDKHIEDLQFIKHLLDINGNHDSELRKLFEKVGITDNSLK